MTDAADPIIGLAGPDYVVPIERGSIRAFAKSIYSHHPAWLEDPTPVVPPTFLLSAGYHWGYILERPPAGSALVGIADNGPVMDGEQEFVFAGPPPRAGSVLTASTRLADHFFKSGRSGGRLEFFVMETVFRDQSGRIVAIWRPTSIRTESLATHSFTPRRGPLPFLRKTDRRDLLDAIGPAAPEDLVPGGSPGPLEAPPLTLTEMIRYQCASGEDSPGHHDRGAAQAHGFPDVFSVGMHHAGVLAAYAAHWLGPENVRRFRARFLDVVWPGDVLTYSGTITGIVEEEGGPFIDMELACTRDGTPVVRAWARFRQASAQ